MREDESQRKSSSADEPVSAQVSDSNYESAGEGSKQAVQPLLLLPDSTIASFHILNLVGRSSLAEAWLAYDSEMNREVVLKVLKRCWTSDAGQRMRLVAIGKKLMEIHHDNVLRVYCSGEAEDLVYFAIEAARGSLLQRINRKGKFTVEQATEYMLQIVDGASAVWEKGLVHGDLKPSNIMLQRGGGLKIADFALVQATREFLTRSSPDFPITGAEYMSPEAICGEGLNHQSDMYSLGMTYAHMLDGRPPFSGTVNDVLHKNVSSSIPELDRIASEHGRGVMETLLRMTAKTPEDRFESYAELTESLRCILEKGGDATPYSIDSSSSEFPDLERYYAEEASQGSASASSPLLANLMPQARESEKMPNAPETPLPDLSRIASQDKDPSAEQTPVLQEESWSSSSPALEISDEIKQSQVEQPPLPAPRAPQRQAVPETSSAEAVAVSQAPPPTVAALPQIQVTKPSLLETAKRQKALLALATAAIVLIGGGIFGLMSQSGKSGTNRAQQKQENSLKAQEQPPSTRQSEKVVLADAAGSGKNKKPTASSPEEREAPTAPPDIMSIIPTESEKANSSSDTSEVPKKMANEKPAGPVWRDTSQALIVDDGDPNSVLLMPHPEAWRPSAEPRRSYANGSLVAKIDGTNKSATFRVSIPKDGQYEILLFWVSSGADFRSPKVPVFIHTASGIKKTTLDQVSHGDAFESIGEYELKAGANLPVVSISTAGLQPSPGNFVSVDAVKLIYLGNN